MINEDFKYAWPDYVDVIVEINWTTPVAYDLVFSDDVPENQTAYFYSIVSREGKHWITHYIGMVYQQTVAVRHKQNDHKNRLGDLQKQYPGRQFLLCLGTPLFSDQDHVPEKYLIEEIESLLIYSNWHENLINKRKVNSFFARRQFHITNSGWTKHIVGEIGYGVFCRDA